MAAYFGDPGISGNSNPSDMLGSLLPIMDEIRRKNLQDYQTKQQIDQDMAVRQASMRRVYDPQGWAGNGQNVFNPNGSNGMMGSPNVVMKQDITPYEKAQLGLEGRKIDIESQRAAASAKTGEERIGLGQEKNELERQKSQQIHETKMADMQRKIEDSDKKLDIAREKLRQNADNADALKEFRDAQIASITARHEAQMAQKEHELEETKRLHETQMNEFNKKLDEANKPKQTKTKVNAEGTERTTTTTKLSGNKIRVTNGKESGTVDESELDQLPSGWKKAEE